MHNKWFSILLLIICCSEKHSPQTSVTPIGPESGYVDSVYNFSTYTVDLDEDNVAFRFDWGDGQLSDWSDYIAPEETVIVSHSWITPDIDSINAQVMDEDGDTSGWSKPVQIVISGVGGPWAQGAEMPTKRDGLGL